MFLHTIRSSLYGITGPGKLNGGANSRLCGNHWALTENIAETLCVKHVKYAKACFSSSWFRSNRVRMSIRTNHNEDDIIAFFVWTKQIQTISFIVHTFRWIFRILSFRFKRINERLEHSIEFEIRTIFRTTRNYLHFQKT